MHEGSSPPSPLLDSIIHPPSLPNLDSPARFQTSRVECTVADHIDRSILAVEWQEAGSAAGQLLGVVPLKLDWTQPALPMRTDPTQLGFEDAFANLSEDAAPGAGGRNRRLWMQSRLGGDPESMRAEQLLAAGASAMQMGDATAQKSKSGR